MRVKHVNIVNLNLTEQNQTTIKKPQTENHTTTKYYGVQIHKRTKSQRGIACSTTARQLKSAAELQAFFPQAWQITPYSLQTKSGQEIFFYSTVGLIRILPK